MKVAYSAPHIIISSTRFDQYILPGTRSIVLIRESEKDIEKHVLWLEDGIEQLWMGEPIEFAGEFLDSFDVIKQGERKTVTLLQTTVSIFQDENGDDITLLIDTDDDIYLVHKDKIIPLRNDISIP